MTGRPSRYKPAYAKQLIAHMKEGLSFESFGGIVGVSKQTLYNWEKEHPEFLDAKKIGEVQSQLWWEKIGIQGLWSESWHQGGSKALNATAWIFNMKNRFKWRDKQPDEEDTLSQLRSFTLNYARKGDKSE